MMGLVLGWGVGLGVILMIRGLLSHRPTLAHHVQWLKNPGTFTVQAPEISRSSGLLRRIDRVHGHRLASLFTRQKLFRGNAHLQTDLHVTATTLEQLAVDKLVCAISLTLVVAAGAAVSVAFGTSITVMAFLVLMLPATFVIGFLVPDMLMAAEARQRRTEFRHSLSSYLDLVAISMSGGALVQSALSDALGARQPVKRSRAREAGWVFEELRKPVQRAARNRQPPWDGLGALGADFDVPELVELTSSVSSAGLDGARVGASLTARAQSLRARRMSEAEAEAAAAGEKMSLPISLLALGFLLFIGYPAVIRVVEGFG